MIALLYHVLAHLQQEIGQKYWKFLIFIFESAALKKKVVTL
ncbi:hypothetical protein [Streptococcus acidominimus]